MLTARKKCVKALHSQFRLRVGQNRIYIFTPFSNCCIDN